MIFKDLFPLILSGYGLVALLVSVLTYYFFDNLYPQHQVLLFTFAGMLFLPFTIILLVIGIMKYMEKNKYKIHFFGGAIVGMLVFAVLVIVFLVPIAKRSPEYLNEHVISGEYIMNDNNYIYITATGLSRGDTLQSITFDVFLELDAPDLSAVAGEFIQIRMNDKQSCIVHSFMEAQEQVELSCTYRDLHLSANPFFTQRDFERFEAIFLQYGNIGTDTSLNLTHGSNIIITKNEQAENVYDKYFPEE